MNRRAFLTLSAATGAVTLIDAHNLSAQESAFSSDIERLGGTGGGKFSFELPLSVGFAWGRDDGYNRIRSFRLNEKTFGGPGGSTSNDLRLSSQEYISGGFVRHSSKRGTNLELVEAIGLSTNRGNSIVSQGWIAQSRQFDFSNARVCLIGGRSGSWLDQLAFEIIKDYVPSERVATNQRALLGWLPRNTEYFTSTRSEFSVMQAWSRTLSSSVTRTSSSKINVAAELSGKLMEAIGFSVNAGAALETARSTTSTSSSSLSNQTQRVLESIEQTKTRTNDRFAFSIGIVDIYRDPAGAVYVVPKGPERLIDLPPERYQALDGILNLSPGIEIELGQQARSEEDLFYAPLERLRINA